MRCKVHLSARYFLIVLADPYSVLPPGAASAVLASWGGLLFSFFDPPAINSSHDHCITRANDSTEGSIKRA